VISKRLTPVTTRGHGSCVPARSGVCPTGAAARPSTSRAPSSEHFSAVRERKSRRPQADGAAGPGYDPAPAHAYGYGYFLGTVCGHRARFHPGDNPGYQSFLGYLPDLRATVAILCNDEETDLDDLLRELAPELARIEIDLEAHS
jgi:Beta-lactamase